MHLNYYDDPFQYENVRTEYKRVLKEKKEIDFDAILLISEELLASCAFIGSNIASVISSILVDEFQDTNELQYSILSTIYKANKSIILMFVGDVNQAIYSSLGGVAKGKKELETLYEINFDSLSLKGCYRSTQRLVDLYSRFEISKTDAHSVAKYKDEHGEIHFFDSVYYTDLASKIAELIKKELRKGTKAEEICVIAPQWFMLFDLSGKLRLLLPDISFDAPDISPIKYNPMNPLFLIAKLLFMPAGKNVKLRKRIAIEFISIIRDDFRIMVPDVALNKHDDKLDRLEEICFMEKLITRKEAAEILGISIATSTSEYVVSNRDGEPLSYTQFKRLWQYIVTRTVKERSYYRYEDGKRVKHTVTPVLGEKAAHNGKVVYSLDFEVTPHQLRHTYITNLIHASVDPKTVQYLAGHESSKITMDIYAKVKYNRPDELVRSMNCAFASWDAAQ